MSADREQARIILEDGMQQAYDALIQVMDPMPDDDPALPALRPLLDVIDMARRIGSVALRNHDSLYIAGRAAQLAGASAELVDAYPQPEPEP